MESNLRSWSSYITTWEVAEELNIDHSRVVWHLKRIGKVKRLNKWEPHELTENQKNCYFEVSSSFILHNNLWTIARLDCDMWQKEDFIWWPAQCLDWEEAPSTSQSQTCSKGPGHCLVVWFQSGLLQLSESQRNHYIWEVCSANQWYAPKTAKPTAIIVNNNMDPVLLTTSVSKVEWIGSRTKFCLICHVHVTSHQPISSSNISTTFCRKKASTPSRRQKMLLKNLWKSEAQFLHCRNKLISHWQKCIDSSVQFSSVVSDSLWPHEPQHTSPPCLSPTPGVYPNPCPLSRRCHPTISSSVVPFSSCIRVFSNESALRIRWPKYWSFSFNISLSKEHPGLISFRMDWLDLLAVQGTLKGLLQHHSSKASLLQCSAFFIVQLSHPCMTTGNTIALTRQTFVGKVMSLLFSVLFRLVIAFLKLSLLISWLQSLMWPKLRIQLSLGNGLELGTGVSHWD